MAEKENKYIVIKVSDVEKYLYPETRKIFDRMLKLIGHYRGSDGKSNDNKYVVCNQDEPYADLVWQIILLGEDAKHNNNETIK